MHPHHPHHLCTHTTHSLPPLLLLLLQVGLSEFHHRDGLDVSMPLFSMVTFTDEQRRVPIADRKFLVTFRWVRTGLFEAGAVVSCVCV